MNSKKIKLGFFFAAFSMFFVVKAFASQDSSGQQNAENGKQEAFNPTPAILEHIGDSHYWHLWNETSIPLPIILFTDQGLETFSSIRFNRGRDAYEGKYHTYKLVEDKIKVVDKSGNVDKATSKKIYDFSVTKNVIALWVACLLLMVIFFSVAATYKKTVGKAPKGFQSLMEPVIVFVRDEIARPNIGYKYQRYMPLLLTIFFFIWINNMLGLIPAGANTTGNVLVTFVLATIVLIAVNVSANKYYWKHIFFPDVPLWLYPIMIPVELIGIISRPFALMIRLYANISAGHIIVLSLISLIFIFKSFLVAPVSIAFVLFMYVLELLVAFLQAFIFTMLTALFIGTAVEEHHH
ncbi:F0F1 ATP synthase subunit A [Mucilaginibacter arboris]|uniref:F0F1 ATP synthase subunit A n=1 Tax=Mucilaginibacter arboris TaxID=2682090 RepID=UPI00293BBD98|nr:F0F1 ATP synthase subunit A [Mucilaginibacter arboris]